MTRRARSPFNKACPSSNTSSVTPAKPQDRRELMIFVQPRHHAADGQVKATFRTRRTGMRTTKAATANKRFG